MNGVTRRRAVPAWLGAAGMAAAGLALSLVAGLAGSPPAQAASISARTLLNQLPVAAENSADYDRERDFGAFRDADRDGCDTRAEVLIAEAVRAPQVLAGCYLQGGRWVSKYDAMATADPTDLQIDHVVALAEAWRSGAANWSDAKRRRFANDLGYPGSLIAVSAHTNLSKSDQTPGEWTPPDAAARCWFVADYITVKWRWRLAVDSFEKAELNGLLNYCKRTGQSTSVSRPSRAA